MFRSYWGQCCAKTIHDLVNFSSNWWATLHLKDIFISSSWFISFNMDMAFERCYRVCIWMNVGRMHPPRLTVVPSVLKLKCALHRMNMGDEHHWWCQIISFYKLIWQAKRDPLRRASGMQHRAFYDKLWEACLDDLAIPWRLMTEHTWRVCFNWRQVHNWLTILMGVDMMHTTNQRIILRRIQERKSFMMNQATPHLGAESSLINSESSNRRGQPRMGTALTSEWWLSHEWANASEEQRRLWNANKGTLWRWSIKEGGTYISNQVRMHACHLTSKHCAYFWVVTEKSSMKSSKIVDRKNHWVDNNKESSV